MSAMSYFGTMSKIGKSLVLCGLLFGTPMSLWANPTTPNTQSQVQTLPHFAETAMVIKHALSNKDYARITPHIHPKKGVRFSMYAHVNAKTDKVFSQANFKKYLAQSNIKFTWGEKDGTGDLYIDTLPNYLTNWIVRQNEFANTTMHINDFEGSGNSLNNLNEQYPNADFVEFYYKGTTHWENMDWRALRLVFETYQGRPYLVAIITDEWTI